MESSGWQSYVPILYRCMAIVLSIVTWCNDHVTLATTKKGLRERCCRVCPSLFSQVYWRSTSEERKFFIVFLSRVIIELRFPDVVESYRRCSSLIGHFRSAFLLSKWPRFCLRSVLRHQLLERYVPKQRLYPLKMP